MEATGRFARIRAQLRELNNVAFQSKEEIETNRYTSQESPKIIKPYTLVIRQIGEELSEAEQLLDEKTRVIELLHQENAALRQNNDKLRHKAAETVAVLNSLGEGVFIIDVTGKCTYLNDRGRDLFGDIAGMPFPLLSRKNELGIRSADGRRLPVRLFPMKRVLKRETVNDVICINPAGKEKVWLRYSAVPVINEKGNVAAAIAVFTDITEREQMRDALQQSEERFSSVLANSLDAIYRRDLRSDCYDYLSPAIEKTSGYTVEEFLHLPLETVLSMIHPEDRTQVNRLLEQIMTTDDDTAMIEYRLRRKDGQYCWVADQVKIVKGKDGTPLYRIGVMRDISERKQTEQALRKSEFLHRELALALEMERSKLAAVIESLPVGLGVSDNQGRMLSLNGAGQKLFGFTSENEVLRTAEQYTQVFELRSPDGRILPLEEWPVFRALRGEYVLEFEVFLRNVVNGHERLVSYSVAPVTGSEGYVQLLVYALMDKTDQRRVEQSLRRERELLQTILDSIPVMITVYDPDIRRFRINEAIAGLTGWTQDDFDNGDVMNKIYPDPAYRQMVFAYMQELTPGWRDLVMTRKDGSTVDTSWANVKIADGRQVGIGVDVTKRKQTEKDLAKLARELDCRVRERTSQLEALNLEMEGIAYSLSHDLRTPLRAVEGFCYLLTEEYKDSLDAKGLDYLERSRSAARKAWYQMDAVLDLLRVTRVELTKEPVNLSVLVRELADEYQAGHPDDRVHIRIQPDVAGYGHADLLRIVLQNLLDNAFKYTRTKEGRRIAFGSFTMHGEVVYYVKDNGVGFDMKFVGKLFNIFQRLHVEDFQGIGVGLASVRHVVLKHGGRVWAEGKPGQGATFYFTLG